MRGTQRIFWGDLPRAIDCYNAALEYADDQPQLYFFFGGMLMRSGYQDEASHQLKLALALDPENPIVLREYARNLVRLGKFVEANDTLSEAEIASAKTLKDMILIVDLRVQYFQRYIDHLLQNGAYQDADRLCDGFVDFLEQCNEVLIDRTTFEHIGKVRPALRDLNFSGRIDAQGAKRLSDFLANPLDFGSDGDDYLIGSLKKKGRQGTYGFLVGMDGAETFIASATLRPELWDWLIEDRPVRYRIRTKPDGRDEAIDVEIVKLAKALEG